MRLEPWHPEIILLLVVLVCCSVAKRLPDAARSLGRSMRIFKSEVKQMQRRRRAPAQPTTAPESRAGSSSRPPPTRAAPRPRPPTARLSRALQPPDTTAGDDRAAGEAAAAP